MMIEQLRYRLLRLLQGVLCPRMIYESSVYGFRGEVRFVEMEKGNLILRPTQEHLTIGPLAIAKLAPFTTTQHQPQVELGTEWTERALGATIVQLSDAVIRAAFSTNPPNCSARAMNVLQKWIKAGYGFRPTALRLTGWSLTDTDCERICEVEPECGITIRTLEGGNKEG